MAIMQSCETVRGWINLLYAIVKLIAPKLKVFFDFILWLYVKLFRSTLFSYAYYLHYLYYVITQIKKTLIKEGVCNHVYDMIS